MVNVRIFLGIIISVVTLRSTVSLFLLLSKCRDEVLIIIGSLIAATY